MPEGEQQPLLAEPGGNPKGFLEDARFRSVFAPGRRRVMNDIPIMLNVLLPWLAFVVTCYLWAFRVHFTRGQELRVFAFFLVLVCLYPLGMLIRTRQTSHMASWYGYAFIVLSLGVGLGISTGNSIYTNYMWKYYKYESMQSYPMVDVGKVLGVHMLDAGRIYFGADSHIDGSISWHFKDRTLYCVAPITNGAAGQDTHSYDFWAVGTDCCAETSTDFRCGEYKNAKARAGLRVLDEGLAANYRLAVQQASALYGFHTTDPIFVTWTQDPLSYVVSLESKGWWSYITGSLAALVIAVAGMLLVSFRFAFMGRAARTNKAHHPDV